MSKRVPPCFYEQENTYFADTCIPVAEAAQTGSIQLESLVHGTYPGRHLPSGVLQGIKSLGFWNATYRQNWGLDWHRNEGIEFTMLSNGELPFSLEEKDYLLQPGDLTVTRPWQPHRVGNPNIGINKLYFIILDVGVRKPHQDWKWPSWIVLRNEDLEDLTLMLRQNEQHVLKATPEIRDCLEKIGRAVMESRKTNTISKITISLNEFLLSLLEMFRNYSLPLNKSLTSTQRSVKLFLTDLKNELATPWTVHIMADECGVGVTSFEYYCKQITNMTPMQYLQRLRVEKASDMLRADLRANVLEIALDCGFSSSQYFASCFKKITGLTPSDYRSDIRQGHEAGAAVLTEELPA